MAVRVGEMMVVIRAQDFASRTLRRVGGEMAGMSKQQAMLHRANALQLQQMQTAGRIRAGMTQGRELQLLKNRIQAQRELTRLQTVTPGWVSPARLAAADTHLKNLDRDLLAASPAAQRFALRLNAIADEATRMKILDAAIAGNVRRMEQLAIAAGMTRREMAAFNKTVAMMPLQRIADVGHALSGVGRTLQLFGAVGLAALGGTAAYFAKFNQQASLAATQTVTVGQGFQAIQAHVKPLQEAIYSLMRTFPASGEEMAKSAYDIYSSMQVTFGGGIKLLKLFNQLAVATGTDLQTATNAGITALNNFGNRGTSVQRIIQLMTATVHYGRMRLGDFNDMLNKVAPAAASAGMSLKDVAGAMALITTRQPSQAQAATGIARLIQVFQDPDFQKGVSKATHGLVSLTKAGGGLKPLPVIINEMAKNFHQVATEKGAIQLFRELTSVGRGTGRGVGYTIFAQRAWTFLFKNLKDYNTLQGKVTGDTKDFARSLRVMMQSPGVRMQVLINQLRLLALEIGEAAIPYILKLGDSIQRLVHWFETINPHTKNLVARIAVFASAASLLGGIVLGIVGPLLALWVGLKKIGIGLAEGEGAAIRLAAVLRFLPAIGLGALVVQIFGVVKAIKILALAWIAWKGIAVAQAAYVAAANTIAATETAGAWAAASIVMRRALIRSGVGLALIAVGIAADYVIEHWDKVRAFFAAMSMNIAATWRVAWDFVAGYTDLAFAKMEYTIGDFVKKNIIFGGLISKAWKFVFGDMAGDARKQGQAEIAAARGEWAKINSDYTRIMAQNRKARKKDAKKDPMAGLFSTKFWKDLMRQANDASGTLNNLYNNVMTKETELARARKSAMKEARQQLQQERQTALQTLSATYASLHQQNEQAMGDIFGGPTMQGIFGQVFSNMNDQLRQFGIQIAVPFQFLRQDMDQQMTYFKRWRGDLNKLLKRGVPKRMILAIAKLGPEAIPMIEGLLGASPAQLKKYVADYKTIQKQINIATNQDMNRQLAVWRTHGKKAMWAILQGADEASAGLQDKWKKYINRNFGDVLKTELARLYKIALENAMAGTTITLPPTKPGTKGGAGAGGGADGGGRGGAYARQMQAQYAKDRRQLMGTTAAWKQFSHWMVQAGSPGGITITGKEAQTERTLLAQRVRLARIVRREQERASVARQLNRNPVSAQGMISVTYGGDTVTIHADGATPEAVNRAIRKLAFKHKNRHRRHAQHSHGAGAA